MPIKSWFSTFSRWQPHGDRVWVGPVLWWLLLWVAWAIRLWHLDASDLTFDEAATYVVAYRPLPDILAYLRQAVREHPPLFYLFIRPWMSLAGTSEYSLRFFAVGASMVGITLTARLARTLGRQLKTTAPHELLVASLLPALIMALFPQDVYYARDARMYTLTVVWAALSSHLFLPLLFHTNTKAQKSLLPGHGWPSPSTLVKIVLVNGLALFTHYYLILLTVTQFASLLLLRRWRSLVAWSFAHGLVGLMGVVWLLRAPGLSSSLSEAWGRFVPAWPSVGQLRRLLAELLFGPIRGVPWGLVYGLGALVALGFLAVWLRRTRAETERSEPQPAITGRQTMGVWLILTTLLPLALAFLMPEPPVSRRLIFVLPFAALALGQLPFALTDRHKVILACLGLSALTISVLGIYGLPRTVKWIKSTYGGTIATVSAYARPGDGVLFYGPWQWIQFRYYGPDAFPPTTTLPGRAPPLLVPEEVEPVLHQLLQDYQRLWVIPAAVDDVDPAHFVDGWLNTHAHPVQATHELSLYLPPPEQEALSLPLELAFGDRLRLERLTSDARSVPAGEGLRMTLSWVVSAALDGDVQLDLLLVDQRNNLWRQWQQIPRLWSHSPSTWEAGESVTDRQGVMVPQGAPPGTYTVRLAVIDRASGAPLQPTTAAGPLPQASVDLFSFEVREPVSRPVLRDVGDFVGPYTFESPGDAAGVLTLAGYELGGLKFQQGYPVPLRLHWLAPTAPVSGVELRLQLRHRSRWRLFDSQTTSVATSTLSMSPDYPTGEWLSGRLVSLPTALSIPVDAPPGSADLTLAVLGPDGEPWTIAGSQMLTLGQLNVEERPLLRRVPDDLTGVQLDFADAVGDSGDQIGLRGFRVEGEAKPGGRLDLTYAWYASSQPSRIYSVFNHLVTADGQPVAQVDGWPQGGKVLTNQWRPGEYVEDIHTLEIPTEAPPGPYVLLMGLYDAASRDRMQAFLDGKPLPNDQWRLPIGGGPGD